MNTSRLLLDLRPFDRYLQSHVHGSISLMFEAGPGFGGRARDLLPIDSKLVLIGMQDGDEDNPTDDAMAMLRGKGFEVIGYSPANDWPERIATRDVMMGDQGNARLINVGDPGTLGPEGLTFMPVEHLWHRAGDLDTGDHSKVDLGVLAGWGVRAATAIGILENRQVDNLCFVRTRPKGSRPATTTAEVGIFRVGGPA